MIATAEKKTKAPAKQSVAKAPSEPSTTANNQIAFQLFTRPLVGANAAQAAAGEPSPNPLGESRQAPTANAVQPSAHSAMRVARSPEPGAPPLASDQIIVDDESPIGPGQISRTQFMEMISAEIERAAGEELAAVGRTAADCPYLAHWLNFYRRQSALHIERAVQRYASPQRSDLATMQTAMASRVRTAVRAWIRTGGREVQAPEGVSWFGTDDQVPDGEGGVQALAVDGAGDRAPLASDPAAVQARLTAGHALDGGVRTRMESGFGQSFSGVRLHTDAVASQLASSLSARAFTVGNHIAFAAGQYNPGTLSGDAIIAHELAHTLQQRGAVTQETVAHGYESDERRANLAAASALSAGEIVAPDMGHRGLSLRRCSTEAPSFDPSDVDLGYPSDVEPLTLSLMAVARDEYSAEEGKEWLLMNDEATGTAAARELRLQYNARWGNDYLALLHLFSENLNATEFNEVASRLGADPLAGQERLDLTPGAKQVYDALKTGATAAGVAGSAAGGAIDGVITAMRAASPEDLRLALFALTRTYDAAYGNYLHRVQRVFKDAGSDVQYREFVRLIHSPVAEQGLDEADPVLGAMIEAEALLLQQGGTSSHSPDEMLALFRSRAREVALTMLRESEAQLIRVLTRTEGGGAPTEQIEVETEKIVATMNDVLKTAFRTDKGKPVGPVALKSFSEVRPALEQEAQRANGDTSEPALRRNYNRMVQITLNLIGAKLDLMMRTERARIQKIMDKDEEFLNRRHIIQGQHPINDMFVGPVGPMQRKQKVIDEWNRRKANFERLEPQRDGLKKKQEDLEAALPLLGGLDDTQLGSLATATPEKFDELRDAALARVLGNVEKIRKNLIDDELNLWMIDKVVARTKLNFGIEDPAANPAQQVWADLIKSKVDQARADARATRDFLEILNTAALIAALGTAIFTGGGSLALYVGLASTGIALGTSIYDLVDTRSKLEESETMYGSGLTHETRLSDVPPDWRLLYSAWLNLGINAVMAVFMIKGLGSAKATVLRGEEAVVEKEVRALAQRLRTRGVQIAEDDIVKATMQALREQGMITGATRGASIYRTGTKVRLVGGPGRSLEQEFNQQLLTAGRLHGATVAKDTVTKHAADEVAYILEVPLKKGGVEKVALRVRSRAAGDLAPGPHGTESGPGRLIVTRDAKGWQATIEVDQTLDPRDLKFVGGHELDEIADLVHRRPTARPGDIARETQSAYFHSGGTTRTATGRAVPLPAHDAANAAELKGLMDEVARLRGISGTLESRAVRELQIDALMNEMGLNNPAHLADRAAALRKAGVDEAVVRKIEARAALGTFQATAPISAEAQLARAATRVTEDRILHLMYAEGRTGSQFVNMGVSGGHITDELLLFEKANPQFAFELEKTKQVGAATYSKFKQYRWKGDPTKAPGVKMKSLRPGGSKFNPADWDVSSAPKTTGDSLQAMLRDAEDAYGTWRKAHPTLASSSREWGRGLKGTQPAATSASGIEFSGFADPIPATSTGGAAVDLKTLYVDAQWF